jgi:hypothetical protein
MPHLMNLANKYNIYVIETYLEIDKDNFIIAIFEKEKATDLHDIYKDGFHIIFNNTICDIPTRHLIRREVINTYNNSSDKILEQYIEYILYITYYYTLLYTYV